MPSGSLTQARAAVAADVEEAVRPALVVADEQQALAADLARDERAARGERLRVADAHPAAEEEVLGLPGGDLLVDVGARRQLAWPRAAARRVSASSASVKSGVMAAQAIRTSCI